MAKAMKPRPPRAAPPPKALRGDRAVIIAVVTAVVAGFGFGWLANEVMSSSPRREVTVLDTYTGKIVILSLDHTEGCVQGEGKRVCSEFVTHGEL